MVLSYKSSVVMEAGYALGTSAVSVKDTYAVESTYVAPESYLPWDGTNPVVVFGRVTYEDAFGKLYCTPFAATYLNPQAWSNFAELSPGKPISDLCPAGVQ